MSTPQKFALSPGAVAAVSLLIMLAKKIAKKRLSKTEKAIYGSISGLGLALAAGALAREGFQGHQSGGPAGPANGMPITGPTQEFPIQVKCLNGTLLQLDITKPEWLSDDNKKNYTENIQENTLKALRYHETVPLPDNFHCTDALVLLIENEPLLLMRNAEQKTLFSGTIALQVGLIKHQRWRVYF